MSIEPNASLAWLQDPCQPLDVAAIEAARFRQDRLTKPRGSLGRLEEMAIQLCGMQRTATPSVDPVQVLQFVSDHGVATEGVSLYPRVVSFRMLHNIARGGAPVSVMAAALGARMEIFDLGVLTDPGPIEGVRSERLGPGTGNIVREPAMTEAQVAAALEIGRAAVLRALDGGARLLICGEMGIGNTTEATALACALLGVRPTALTGPGTGINAAGVARKADVVARALAYHAAAQRTPLELLQRLGGFDIAASVGAYIAAAQRGLAILVDGFIMTAAALAAVRINPGARDWMLFSHRSAEPGHRVMLEALDANPYLDFRLRLGEATGALPVVPLLRLACVIHSSVATLQEAGIDEPPDD